MGYQTKHKPHSWNTLPHLGLELEFDFMERLPQRKNVLNDEIKRLGYEHQARVDFEFIARYETGPSKMGYELSLLTIEGQYRNDLEKLIKLLKDQKAYTDERCGFHIHIDCRHRNKMEVYDTLVENQEFLLALADKSRIGNAYCDLNDPFKAPHENSAVKPSTKYNTIELRIFEASLDIDKLDFYVKTVIAIVNFNTRLDIPIFNRGGN